MKMRLARQREDEELAQLATRIPLRTARRLKEFCVRNEVRMQTFVAPPWLRSWLTRAAGLTGSVLEPEGAPAQGLPVEF